MKKSFTLLECLFALFILSLIVVSLFPHLLTLKSWKGDLNSDEKNFYEKKSLVEEIKNRAYSGEWNNLVVESNLNYSLEISDDKGDFKKVRILFEEGEDIYEVIILKK